MEKIGKALKGTTNYFVIIPVLYAKSLRSITRRGFFKIDTPNGLRLLEMLHYREKLYNALPSHMKQKIRV